MAPLLDRRALLASTAGIGTWVLLDRPAGAQLRVDITRGVVEPLPIAISPLAGDPVLGTQIADVVQADLDGSGLFRTIDRRAYIQKPEELRSVPRFADWRQINAQALVSGVVTPTAQGIAVEFRLWDVLGGAQMTGLRFEGPADRWRRIAHKIADAIYERMTGEKGYFDTRIVYVAESGPATRKVKRIAVMDQDGANHRFLTDGRELVLTPRIAPNATSVAYMAYRGRTPKVYVRPLEGSGGERILVDSEGMSFAPRFAPDGRRMLVTIAQGGNSDIWEVSAGGGRRRLTAEPGIDTSPSFSPDGQRIVFNSDRGGRPNLYVMNADGSGVQRISYGEGRYFSPMWSPRGDLIAFVNIKERSFHIGVMRPDGSDERLITRSWQDEGPAWSPNGRIVLFYRLDRATDRSELRRVDITGYNERVVPTPQAASDPDWSGLIP